MDTQDHPLRTQTTSNTKDDTKDIYTQKIIFEDKIIFKDTDNMIYESADWKMFDFFWKRYPRKGSKKESLRIFLNLNKDKKLKVLKNPNQKTDRIMN